MLSGFRLRLSHPPAAGLLLGACCAAALVALSAINVFRASALQYDLNREYALTRARAVLADVVSRPASAAGPMLDSLLHAPLGFSFLSVRDTQDVVLAAAGRYENLSVPLLTRMQTLRLREYLYRLTSDYGHTALKRDGEVVGSLDYAISDIYSQQVHEQAVDRLRLSGWLGLVVSLPLLAGFALVLRHRSREDPAWIGRLDVAPLRAAEPTLVPGAGPDLAPGFRLRAGTVLDAAGQGIISVDRDGGVRYLNRTAEQLTGWTAADAVGQKIYSVFHVLDADASPQLSAAELCLRESRDVPPAACRQRARNGSLRPVTMSAALLRSGDGAVEGAVMLFQDNSAHEAQLEELRRQARLSQGVIDHLDEGILTTDPAGVVRFANARALRMFGYSREELEGVTVTKLMPVPFLNTPGIRLADYIAAKSAGRLPKVVGWRKDATTFPIELLVQPMSMGGDHGLVVVLRDISERLRGENLASRLGRLLDSAAEEVYIFDAQTLYLLEVNRGARRNLGYRADQLARMTPLNISAGLDAETFQGYLSRLRGGETEHLTYRAAHRRADGSEYPVEVRLNFSRDEEPPVFMAIATDISRQA